MIHLTKKQIKTRKKEINLLPITSYVLITHCDIMDYMDTTVCMDKMKITKNGIMLDRFSTNRKMFINDENIINLSEKKS